MRRKRLCPYPCALTWDKREKIFILQRANIRCRGGKSNSYNLELPTQQGVTNRALIFISNLNMTIIWVSQPTNSLFFLLQDACIFTVTSISAAAYMYSVFLEYCTCMHLLETWLQRDTYEYHFVTRVDPHHGPCMVPRYSPCCCFQFTNHSGAWSF